MKLNCIIIEDDPIQRAINTKLVINHPNLNLIGAFWNAIEAKKCLSFNKIDLLFLDIEMPLINGFSLLDSITEKPQIIFISSHEEYAIKAFNYNATDYIKKPVTLERFNVAVKKAFNFHVLKNKNSSIEQKEEKGEHIIIKSNFKQQKLFTNKINWVEAYGDYVKVITEKGSNIVLSTMKSFEKLLSNKKFIRVHKSYIVNADKVKKFNCKFAEIGITKIPLSRNKKEKLAKILSQNQ